jgi:leucyl-tRNA synthetase
LGYLSWKSDDIAKMQKHIERARELSTDNQVVKNDISEGDTKDGKSHLRPINQSVFYDYYQGIGRVNEENLSSEMIERFNNLDTYLLEIKKQIDN